MSKRHHSVHHNDLKRMLSAVFTLCVLDNDLKERELDALIATSRAEAKKRIQFLAPRRAGSMDLVLLGSVLHRWNRSSEYLDDEARPFPIRAAGKAPSIEGLFQAENRSQYFKQGMRDLLKAGLVRRIKRGLYLPRNDSILLHTLTPEMVANVALAMNRLVTTLLYNTTASRLSDERLIERNALVTDLPRRKVKEFVRFTRDQGAALISTINDWLELRRAGEKRMARKSRRGTATVGVHLFAFCDRNSRARK
jgi:hypothetical protein